LDNSPLIEAFHAAFGLLAGITLTTCIVVWLRAWSPMAVLVTLTGLYSVAAVCLCRRLSNVCVPGRRFPLPSVNSKGSRIFGSNLRMNSPESTEAIVDCRK
jgi:hypothetical protein